MLKKEEYKQLISKLGETLELVAQDLEQIETAIDNAETEELRSALENELAQHKDVFLKIWGQRHLFPNIFVWDWDESWNDGFE